MIPALAAGVAGSPWFVRQPPLVRPQSALTGLDRGSSGPMGLLDYGWPLADPQAPTPIYDDLVTERADPSGTPLGTHEEVASDGVDDHAGSEQSD